MAHRYILAVRAQEPPDRDHRPVFFSHILVVIEDLVYMTVTVITADVVHTLFVGLVTAFDIFIKFRELALLDI